MKCLPFRASPSLFKRRAIVAARNAEKKQSEREVSMQRASSPPPPAQRRTPRPGSEMFQRLANMLGFSS